MDRESGENKSELSCFSETCCPNVIRGSAYQQQPCSSISDFLVYGGRTGMENITGATIGAVAGAGVALVGIPAAIGLLGFTSAGIAAGSLAAKMMSAAAIANGGGVAAGSTVAVLQSIGAAGFSLGTKIGLTTTLGPLGAAAGAKLFKWNTPE